MIQVAIDDDELTWHSALVPTEAGVQQLPKYGGFVVTAQGRAAMRRPKQPHRSDPTDPSEEWPTDPPFTDD